MAGAHISEADLRSLAVDQLELVDEATFASACAAARRFKVPLERALSERARLPLAFLLEQLAQAWDVGFTDLKITDVDAQALRKVREDYARTHTLVPFRFEADRTLAVAMAQPRDAAVLADLMRMAGTRITPYLAPVRAIRRAQLLYRGDLRTLLRQQAGDVAMSAADAGADKSAAELLTRILEYALLSGASDVHIEPYELEGLVRYRIDGVLQEVLSLESRLLPSLVARIKVLAGMRIDEKRAPQDGHFTAEFSGLGLDLRVSSMPTLWGEKVVMRVIAKEAAARDLEDLGLAPADYPSVLRNVMRPFGMVLVTGPTGSGKTTTLYAMVARLGAERQNVVNISTIEDPVEHPLPRVNQVSVNPSAGMDFANGLRCLLRQDPDVIMVGEIRDRETADIAVRSALVGRLLISTLHTNDATSAIPRLIDMGIEPFLLASTLQMVVAQRLARRICTSCRQSAPPEHLQQLRGLPEIEESIPLLRGAGVLPREGDPLAGARLFHGTGCSQCGGTGYRGRVGLFEILVIDEELRRLTMDRADASTIRRAAIAAGMKTMFQDALAKVLLGETTLEELRRVCV